MKISETKRNLLILLTIGLVLFIVANFLAVKPSDSIVTNYPVHKEVLDIRSNIEATINKETGISEVGEPIGEKEKEIVLASFRSDLINKNVDLLNQQLLEIVESEEAEVNCSLLFKNRTFSGDTHPYYLFLTALSDLYSKYSIYRVTIPEMSEKLDSYYSSVKEVQEFCLMAGVSIP